MTPDPIQVSRPEPDAVPLSELIAAEKPVASPTGPTSSVDTTSTRQDAEELAELVRLTDALPAQYQADFYRAISRIVDGFERRQRILGHVQDSLGQMSLDLKYLIFDLEATRRERDEYQRRLESFI